MSAAESRPPFFANEQWIVTAEGLDHRIVDYFIPGSALAMRRDDGLWAWPLQLAEKTWCAPAPFLEAFGEALRAFGHRADAALRPSLAAFGGSRPVPTPSLPEQRPLGEAAIDILRETWAVSGEVRRRPARRRTRPAGLDREDAAAA